MSAAVVGFWLTPIGVVFRLLFAIGGIIFIAPAIKADLVALLVVAPAVISQLLARKRVPAAVSEF